MKEISEKLFELRDGAYAEFQSKLTPTVAPERFIGVRIPELRRFAREIGNDSEAFLDELPHAYYDENMLHSLLLSNMKDYDVCIERLNAFLPYVDNWAVCDTLSPKVFVKHRKKLISKIPEWISSESVYTCRFGIDMLMSHYLDEDFKPEYIEWTAGVKSDEYYVNMMIAWYFATALAKQWDAVVPYIEENRLDRWVHNKAIQKAVESRRITEEQKTYLRGLRRKQI